MKRTDGQKRLSARLTHRKAFTLVELLVVIAIIGILFVVLISKVDFATDKAKTAGAQTDLRSYELAAYTIGVEQQGFTSDLELLTEQLNKNLDPKLHLNVDGEHITTEAKDPRGKEYRITYNEPDSSRGQIIITSAGVDTKYDTEDDINIIITYTVDEDGGHVEIEMSNGAVNPAPDTPTEPSDPTDPDTPTEPEQGGEQEPVRLAAGLYDAEDNLVASWDELVNTYGMDIEKDYTYSSYNTDAASPYYVLSNYTDLANGIKLIISDDVEKVGSYTFYKLASLTNVDFGAGVTNIDTSSFSTSGLTGEIVIPANVINIGDGAFYKCSGLTGELIIPDSVTTLGVSAFKECSGFTSLTIGSGISSISDNTFDSCSGLTGELIIPDGVTVIGERAFQQCSGLISIDFGSSVVNIGNYAFSACTSFTGNLIIPNSVTTVGDGAFNKCSGFTGNLIIPDSVTSIGSSAFNGCTGFTGDLIIPDSVTSIGSSAFNGCTGFTGELVIPNSVTDIGWYTFYNCSGLQSVKMGSGINNIGESAFNGCTGLTGVYITDLAAWCKIDFYSMYASPLHCAKKLYLNNTQIINLTIPDEITEIKAWTFYNAQNITGSLTIPESVTSIGNNSFRGCSGLTSVSIPNSIASIGVYAFNNCDNLNGVYIADLVAWCQIDFNENGISNPLALAKNLYLNGNPINNLVIPDEITEIKPRTFWGAQNITGTLTIHDNVISIGAYAFNKCSGLTNVEIGNGIKNIGMYAFLDCTNLIGVYITDLAAWCQIDFYDSNSNPINYATNLYLNEELINNLIIPNEVTEIKPYAFYGAESIKTVMIPSSITNIGHSAFALCFGLTSITIESTSFIPYSTGLLSMCPYLAAIYVPADLVETYKSADGWIDFADKIQAIPTT